MNTSTGITPHTAITSRPEFKLRRTVVAVRLGLGLSIYHGAINTND